MKAIHFFLFLLLPLGFISCSNSDDPDPNDLPVRTVLVYMVSSNLGNDMLINIEQMKEAATNKNLQGGNLIVYYSSFNIKTGTYDGELFEIKEGKRGVVTQHHIRDYKDFSAIDPDNMRQIVNQVFSDYQAKSYGMVMSSHATAWFPSDMKSMLRSFGDEGGKYMEIYDLAKALKGLSLDFIAFDACSMGAVECAYELRHCANYIISSPSEIMSFGFPFNTILPHFFTPFPDYENICKSFKAFYEEYKHPYGNLSVVKTSELDELASVCRDIFSEMRWDDLKPIDLTGKQVLSYIAGAPTVLYDLEDIMQAVATDEQKARLRQMLSKTVVSSSYTDQIYCSGFRSEAKQYVQMKTFCGLSVYPPQQRLPKLNEWYRSHLSWPKMVYPD